MKKIIIGVLTLSAIGFGAWKYYNQAQPEVARGGKPVIKIGIGLPLTGDNQESGTIAKNAIELFKKDLANRDTKNNYEFIIDDSDVIQLKQVTLTANKMVSYNKVDAIISYWNNPGVVVAGVLKDKDILHVNFGNDPKVLQTKYDFIFYSSPEKQIEKLLEEAQKRGITRLAVLGCNNEWSHLMMSEIERLKEHYGVEVVSQQIVNIGERNFNTTFEKMRSEKPELYALMLETPEFEIARKKMLEMGIEEPVTSSELPDYTEQRDLFEGIWYVSLPYGDESFNKRMQEFSGNQNTYGAAYMYDIANLIVQAFESVEDKKDVAEAMRQIKSVNGKVGTVSQEDNFFVVPAQLKGIKNGETIILE